MKARLALLLLLLVASPVQATEVKPVNIGKNIDVWMVEDHTLPIVSLTLSFPAGSSYDPAEKPGLANFTASLIDEGAGALNARAYHSALADRGIRFGVNVDRDYMVVSITTLKENLPEALRLLQLALTKPRFDADAVARVRTQIIQSIEQDETEPPAVAQRDFMKAFFNGHPYGHSSDGDVAGVFAVTQDDLRGFARSHWVKGGLKIAIAGDVTAPQAAKLLADTFKPVSDAVPPPPPVVGRLGQPGVHVVTMPVPQPTVMFGLPGIMRSDPDFLPGYVANYILGGGGFSSRLTDEVRVKRGLTYGITTQLSTFHRASVMLGSVATRADAVRQTIDVVKATMADFAQKGPTQAEIDDAKTFLTGSFPIAFASDAGIASQLSVFQRQGLDVGYVAHRNALIQAVTIEDVRRVARKLFTPARLTVVVAGTMQEARGAPQRPQAPVRPTPAPVTPPPAATPSGQAPAPAAPAKKPAPAPLQSRGGKPPAPATRP